MFNSRFRRDIFVKGPIKLTTLEQVELLSNCRFALVVLPEEIEYEIELIGRPIKLDETIYQPLVAALADSPKTLRELMRQPSLTKLNFSAILPSTQDSHYHLQCRSSAIGSRGRATPASSSGTQCSHSQTGSIW